MTAFMFPGQGSQVKGMGANLFAQFSVEVNQANDLLGYPIEDLCLNNPQLLANTAYTQPALYVVEVLSNQTQYATLQPTFCIGHSLGEYAALYVAGAFDFLTGLRLVQKRGALMSAAKAGGMLAVINKENLIKQITSPVRWSESISYIKNHDETEFIEIGPGNVLTKLMTQQH